MHLSSTCVNARAAFPAWYPWYAAIFSVKPIHLVSIYWRDEDITREFWTESTLPGLRFGEKRVYVLTSQVTFSAGEMCADVLQSRQRATINGEKTVEVPTRVLRTASISTLKHSFPSVARLTRLQAPTGKVKG